jgi:hypothetical protein
MAFTLHSRHAMFAVVFLLEVVVMLLDVLTVLPEEMFQC